MNPLKAIGTQLKSMSPTILSTITPAIITKIQTTKRPTNQTILMTITNTR